MKYLHYYDTKTTHDVVYNGNGYEEPWVAYIEDDESVTYNKPHDYSKDYLTFEALESGTFQFSNSGLSYSIDEGKTWTEIEQNTDTPTINAGDRIMFKAELTPSSNLGIGAFSSSGRYEAMGNPYSLLYGDDFIGITDLSGKNNALRLLFYNSTGLTSASHLSLQATTLAENCYSGMFNGCTSLTTAPELPATTLANYCYDSMFAYCTSLTTAPALPATTLANWCYSSMFKGCTSLTTAPELPAMALAADAYTSMFYGCTALTSAPVLPATTLADSCYSSMFSRCTSLTIAPELPATTLAKYCYSGMFYGCTGLVNVPTNLLPVTGNLPQGCYESMFQGCTYLVNAPNLPGLMYGMYCYQYMFEDCTSLTTPPTQLNGYSIYQGTGFAKSCCKCMFKNCTSLTTSPYINVTMNQNSSFSQYSSPMNEMFYGCSSLTQIRIAANYWSGTPAKDWVVGVATNGTFIKSSSLSESTIGRGVNGIPEGWTVQTASA